MSGIDAQTVRKALADLPRGVTHGEDVHPKQVYLPQSHLKAMDPNNPLVTGMRGSGKTFWCAALKDRAVRRLVDRLSSRSTRLEEMRVWTGFGVRPSADEYPGKDVLLQLVKSGVEPKTIWRTVLARQIAPMDHPLLGNASWPARAKYVAENPESIERMFQDRDDEFDARGRYSLVLFDALDRCADDWQYMHRAIRGLLQTAMEMRSYKRLRVKVFLRSDQVEAAEIADFPDASKIVFSMVELNWPRNELYGLLWHVLANGESGSDIRRFLGGKWGRVKVGDQMLFYAPRRDETTQREKFHAIAGKRMGTDHRRGFPYAWIPNHLGDTKRRVSPRSFLEALREAADDTAERYPEHGRALHRDSIRRGVRKASRMRVAELQEDYPWVRRLLDPLKGMVVPCQFEEIEQRWGNDRVLNRLTEEVERDAVKLPPRRIERGPEGVRQDLESLGVFFRMDDGRINVPDVFRVGYGLGRRGGVMPVQ